MGDAVVYFLAAQLAISVFAIALCNKHVRHM